MDDQTSMQDIARSGFADMLNDDERNRAYDSAIQISVAHLIEKFGNGDKFFYCCDIGTGSGLLSMMVVRAFREQNYHNFHVYAFEAFRPMAACAERVIRANDMSDNITVIPRRSDDLRPDEFPKFDLLVAELLDTELIGEGCLLAYRHAVQNLCSDDCYFVPTKAVIYVEPVASDFLFQRNSLKDLHCDLGLQREAIVEINPECEIRPDNEDLSQRARRLKGCTGRSDIYDIQASALKEGEDFYRFSQPKPVFTFWFNSVDSLRSPDQVEVKFPIRKSIPEQVVLIMWWDLYMYDNQTINHSNRLNDIDLHVISCAPTWARSPEILARDSRLKDYYGREVWREHWIQGVYSIPYPKTLKRRLGPYVKELMIYATHDDYSMWFDIEASRIRFPPSCTQCLAQRYYSKAQLGFFSDRSMLPKLVAAVLYYHNDYPVTGQLNFKGPQQDESPDHGFVASYLSRSSNWTITWFESCDIPPINDLHYCDWMNRAGIMSRFMEETSIEMIDYFEIKFTQVHFQNLNRICTRVGNCEGFNLNELDMLVSTASQSADSPVEPHYLWEYGGKRFDRDYIIYSSKIDGIDCKEKMIEGTFWKHFELNILGHDEKWRKGWALVFWIEYTLKNTGDIISTGPQGGRDLYEDIKWNKSCQQHVYFMHEFPISKLENKSTTEIDLGIQSTSCWLSSSQRFRLQVQWPIVYR